MGSVLSNMLHCINNLNVTRKLKLDQVSEVGARRRWSICHGEELNPVLEEATWVLSRVNDESPQAALARFVSQSQLSLALCHIEADVQQLYGQQVKQPSCDNDAVPSTREAKCRAGNRKKDSNVTSQPRSIVSWKSHWLLIHLCVVLLKRCCTLTDCRRRGSRRGRSFDTVEDKCCGAPNWSRTERSAWTQRGSAGSCGGWPARHSCLSYSLNTHTQTHTGQSHMRHTISLLKQHSADQSLSAQPVNQLAPCLSPPSHPNEKLMRMLNLTHQIQWWSRRWTQDPHVRQCPALGGRIILHTGHVLHFAVKVSFAVCRSPVGPKEEEEASDWTDPLSCGEALVASWRLCALCTVVVTFPGFLLVWIRETIVRIMPVVTVHTCSWLTSPRGKISVMKR